ncbi:MAG: hypothetical protein LBO63_01675 [Oscillospiraceae bacterium]|jgi:hypothetical protein|nr:hypothetical protein [Oscillospiraceae bacterium]
MSIITAQINNTQRSKMHSNKAVEKSLANGFTREQHYSAADIKALYESAELTEVQTDKFHNSDAIVTGKELEHHGHRAYSLELNLEMANALRQIGGNAAAGSHSAINETTPEARSGEALNRRNQPEFKHPEAEDANASSTGSIRDSGANVNRCLLRGSALALGGS